MGVCWFTCVFVNLEKAHDAVPLEELEDMVHKKNFWATLLIMLPLDSQPDNWWEMKGLMDGVKVTVTI